MGKITYWLTQVFHLGAGGTWPGEIALTLAPDILKSLSRNLKKGLIIVAGTNGKTTTSLMIKQILEKNRETVVHNATGANLLNGIVSALIQKADWMGNIEADWGVFEVDENSLPFILKQVNESSRLRSNNKRLIIVLLNLFRDQLDRYGEVDVIAEKWEHILTQLPKDATLIANSDDPLIAHLGMKYRGRVAYFGVDDRQEYLPKLEHATDSIFCLNCGGRLEYVGIYYSHLGNWKCEKCGERRPKPNITKWNAPLPGLYNLYNTLAAVNVVKELGIENKDINEALADFSPAFGRQEEFIVAGKRIKIFLSKNPAGFNQSLKTVIRLGAKHLLFILNDRIPDGRDVSWIWDVDFEMLGQDEHRLIISGDRTYDLALRIKYAFLQYNNGAVEKLIIEKNLPLAIKRGLLNTKDEETLYILPTYSAMLDVRKILYGRKIL